MKKLIEKKINKRVLLLLSWMKPYRFQFALLFFCIMAGTITAAVYPYIFSWLVDEVLYGKNMVMFFRIILVYLGVYLLNQLCHFVLNRTWASLMTNFLYDIRRKVFRKVLSYTGEELSNLRSGDVISRIGSDTEQIMEMIHQNIFYGLGSLVALLSSITFLFLINIWLGFCVLILTPIVVFILKHFYNKLRKINQKLLREKGLLSAWIFEVIRGLQHIRSMGASRHAVSKYVHKLIGVQRLLIQAGKVEVTGERVNSAALLFARLILYALSAWFIVLEQLTIGQFTACVTYFEKCVTAFNSFGTRMTSISKNMASASRVFELMERDSETIAEKEKPQTVFRGRITFEGVKFSYDHKRAILNDFSLNIDPGDRVAIVGKSGAGKSTIVSLLCRIYDSDQGLICIDGQPISQFSLRDLRAQIGVVQQDNLFFRRTLRYNIIFSDDSNNDARIWEILKAVDMGQVVATLPDQLDTVWDPSSADLSGGQKQRLAIARLLYKDTKIIIFDEATSALDGATEELISQAIGHLGSDRTMLVIAHRLSTIQHANKVAVLSEGNIVAYGYHEELLQNCEEYITLFREQYAK